MLAANQSEYAEFSINREVFHRAAEKQAELDQRFFGDHNEALQAAREAAHELNIIAYETGLMQQPARIAGNGIYVPRNNLDTGSGILMPTYEQLVADDSGLDLDHYREGEYSGFTYIIPGYSFGTSDGSLPEMPHGHAVKLCHQIKMGDVESPFFTGVACAFGSIDTTRIEFLDEVERDQAREALEFLFSVEDRRILAAVNTINVCLSGDERYSRFNLAKSAGSMRRTLARSKNQHSEAQQQRIKDFTADLVKARLRIGRAREFQVSVKNFLIKDLSKNTYEVGPPTKGALQIRDVDFQPFFTIGSDNKISMDTESCEELCLVSELERDNKHYAMYFPLESIEELRPL